MTKANSRDHADLFSIQLFGSSAKQGHGVSAVWASTTRRKSCCSRHQTFSAVSWARELRAADTTYDLACLAVRRGRRDEAFSLLRGHAAWPIPGTGFRNRNRPDLKALMKTRALRRSLPRRSSMLPQRKKQTSKLPRSTSAFSNFLQSRLPSGWKRRVRLITRATWK
jgi:hypothetical protein